MPSYYIYCHRTTLPRRRVLTGSERARYVKNRDEDEMRGADGFFERPRETSRDTCIVYLNISLCLSHETCTYLSALSGHEKKMANMMFVKDVNGKGRIRNGG